MMRDPSGRYVLNAKDLGYISTFMVDLHSSSTNHLRVVTIVFLEEEKKVA